MSAIPTATLLPVAWSDRNDSVWIGARQSGLKVDAVSNMPCSDPSHSAPSASRSGRVPS